jgi:hypothetical protein
LQELGFGQKESGLEIGRRAEGETFLAIFAYSRGYFRNEPYLPSCSRVNIAHSILFFDLSTVSHAQAAKNAKRGFFVETVLVCAIFLS